MKHILFKRLIALLLFITPYSFLFGTASAAENPKLSSPIYLATVLVNKPDLEQMSDLCRFYNLNEAPSQDGFTVFTTPDGSTVRFKMVESASSKPRLTPVVEVLSKESKKKISSVLLDAGFIKTSSGYESGNRFVPNRTQVTLNKGKNNPNEN